MKMSLPQIQRYLPHRYPFLFLDRVDALVPNETIEAVKAVTANEELFLGHFPGNPILPGVIQIEAMAQAGALLAIMSGEEVNAERAIYIAGADALRFKRPIVPGDVMTIRAKVDKRRMAIWKMSGEIYVGDTLACSGKLTATAGPAATPGRIPEDWPKPPEYP